MVGLSTKDGPPDTVALCAPEVAHEIENQGSAGSTVSLKVIVRLEFTATSVAPFAGEVETTDGRRHAGSRRAR